MRNNKGFTIIEILVVLVILGILATLMVPKLMNKPDEAKVTAAKVNIKAIESALKIYKLDNGMYPTTSQGLAALIKKPDSDPIPKNYKTGGYLEESDMKDPWGNDFVYRCPGDNDRDFDIISYGADGKEGGEGFNADITSYQ